jgi:hypothetical protein
MASVKPSSNNSDSLGTSSVRWGDIYAQDGSFSGTLEVSNLTVTGTTTSIESVSYQVTDPIIVLAQANTSATEALIGIQAERGSSDAWILWDESLDAWVSYVGADTSNLSLSDLIGSKVQGETLNVGSDYQFASGVTGGIQLENVVSLDSSTTSTIQTTAQAVTSMNSLTALGDSSQALAIGSTEVEVNSLKVGGSVPFADASGALTLQNVDALDATTENTIESAIDSLTNLTSIGSSSNVLTISNSRVDMDSLKVGGSIPFADASGVLTLQNVDAIDATTETTIENAIDSLPFASSIGSDSSITDITFGANISVPSLMVGDSSPFSDVSGVLTLANVDALDATTENTIESAIDTLANLTAIGGSGQTLAVSSDLVTMNSLQIGSSNPFSDSTGTLTLQNVDALDATTEATITAEVEANATSFASVTAIGASGANLAISSDLVTMNSLQIGSSNPFADTAGSLTLQNVDALDSTSTTTITSAVQSNATTFGSVTAIGTSGSNLTVSSDAVIIESLQIGSSTPFADASGTLTLQNVDSLDATTENTIESAIDSLPNLTAVGGSGQTLAVSSDLVTLSSLQIGDSVPFADASGTLTLQNVDALDTASRQTIEGALTNLSNITQIGKSSSALAFNGTQFEVGSTGLKVGDSVPFSDASGSLTLQNVDALDATTEATIESAIDSLANLTSFGSSSVATAFIGSTLDLPAQGLKVGASIPFSDSAGSLTLQNVDALDSTSQATITSSVEANATSFVDLTSVGSSLNTLTISNGTVVMNGDALQIGDSVPFDDVSGTLTLQNVDDVDATTRDTISTSILELENLNTILGSTDSSSVLTINGGRVDVPSLKVGASIPFADSAGSLTLQNVDALDTTTRQTIEGALTDLSAITQIGAPAEALVFNGTRFEVGSDGLKVGDSVPFFDAVGSLTLQNVDALDATTEATIEDAIDTLANLTSFGSTSVATSFVGSTLDLPAQGLKVGDSVPFSDASGALTLQNVDALDATSEATIENAIDALPNLATIGDNTFGQSLSAYGSTVSIESDAQITLTSGSTVDRITLDTGAVYLGANSSSTLEINAGSAFLASGVLNVGSDTMVVHSTNGSVGFGTDSPSVNSVAQFNGDIFISSGSAIKNAIDSNDYLRFDTDLSIRSNGGKLLLIPDDNEGLIIREETGFDAFTLIAKDSERQLRIKGRSSAPAFISASGVGSSGDTQGSIVHYNGDLYFCTTDYDSGSPSAVIWKKMSLASI